MSSKLKLRRPKAYELEAIEKELAELHSRRQMLRREVVKEKQMQETEALAMLGRCVVTCIAEGDWCLVDLEKLTKQLAHLDDALEGCLRSEGSVASHIAFDDVAPAWEKFVSERAALNDYADDVRGDTTEYSM